MNILDIPEIELDGSIPGDLIFGVQGPQGPTGPQGSAGEDGEDGGYYTPAVTQPSENKLEFAFTPSKADMPSVQPVQVTLPAGQGSGGNVNFQTNETLTLKDGVLSVNTTNDMEQDNTLPITSAGVFATVGNIEALLKTI